MFGFEREGNNKRYFIQFGIFIHLYHYSNFQELKKNYQKNESSQCETDGLKSTTEPIVDIRNLRSAASTMIQFWRDREDTIHFRGPNFHGTLG